MGSNAETGTAPEQETPWSQNTSATHATVAIRCWQASYMKLNIVSGQQSSAKYRFRKPKEWEQQFTLSCKVTSGRVNAIKFKPASKVFTFKVSPPKYAAPKIPSLNYPASKISSSKYPALTKMIGGWGQNSPAKMIGEMIDVKMIG